MSEEKPKKEKPPRRPNDPLTPVEIAQELRVTRTTVDRLMQLHPEHPDYLEHMEWGQYRSGAKKRRVPPEAWDQWKTRHLVTAKPAAVQRVNSLPKTEASFPRVLEETRPNKRRVEIKRENSKATVLNNRFPMRDA